MVSIDGSRLVEVFSRPLAKESPALLIGGRLGCPRLIRLLQNVIVVDQGRFLAATLPSTGPIVAAGQGDLVAAFGLLLLHLTLLFGDVHHFVDNHGVLLGVVPRVLLGGSSWLFLLDYVQCLGPRFGGRYHCLGAGIDDLLLLALRLLFLRGCLLARRVG